jgi:hypothetical protein
MHHQREKRSCLISTRNLLRKKITMIPYNNQPREGRRERISLLPLSIFSFFIHIADDKETKDGQVV